MKIFKSIIAIGILCSSTANYGQFTDQINSNRPGKSLGGFSVGKKVLQIESGVYYIDESHNILDYDASGFGLDFSARYGYFFEQLEFGLDVQFQMDKYKTDLLKTNRSGLKQTTFGAKYLFYDPYKVKKEEKPNIYSWKANHKFKWKQLIPALSGYVGVNYVMDNDYSIPGESSISPKVVVIAQNHFGSQWVLVTNIIADKISSKASSFGYILTVTRGFNEKWSAFVENRGIKGDYYSDGIIALGATHLLKTNLQVDASISTNFKNSPSLLVGGIGFSWRFDKKHKDIEMKDGKEVKEDKKDKDNDPNKAKTQEELDEEQKKADKEKEKDKDAPEDDPEKKEPETPKNVSINLKKKNQSSMIVIKEVVSKKELTEFVKFPFSLYKNNPYWIPPIISEEVASFDKKENPAFQTAEANFYMAYQEGKAVGRIAVIINWDEVHKQGKKKVRFGWFDVIDDIEVTKALLEKAYEAAHKNNLEHIEGPMGFSNLDKVGVLTYGYDQVGNMITWYNHEYYKTHFETLGFTPEKKYIESVFPFAAIDNPPIKKASELIQKRYGVKALNFTKTSDIMPYVDKMFDLFNNAYGKLESFVAINDIQKEYFKKKYISFINPEFIKFVMDKDDNMVAFAIVMPNFAQALQKTQGKLFPFGFLKLLQARKNSKEVVFYLIGVLPEYQSKGVTAIIFDEYHKTFTEKKIVTCIRTPELEDNHAIHNLWKNFNPIINKKRSTYLKKV